MMVTLTTVNWIGEADALCALLEANGIKTFVPDQNTVTVNPIYANAIGGIRIQVAGTDVTRARNILEERQSAATKGIFKCPKCGSGVVQYQNISKRFAFFTILLIGIPLFWLKRQYICENCGYKWKQE